MTMTSYSLIDAFIFTTLLAGQASLAALPCHLLLQLCVIVSASIHSSALGDASKPRSLPQKPPIELPCRVDCLAPQMGRSSIHTKHLSSPLSFFLSCFSLWMHRRPKGLSTAVMTPTSVPIWKFNVANFMGTTTVSSVMNIEKLK